MIETIKVAADQSPQQVLSTYLQRSRTRSQHFLALKFTLLPYWQESGADSIKLLALYQCLGQQVQGFIISEQSAALQTLLAGESVSLEQLSSHLQTPVFKLDQPMLFQTCAIPKPWGQEIWYTGVEERGVCGIGDGKYAIPLPWLLHVHSQDISGGEDTLVLLKILDPLADPNFGDLYFEMHELKQEVYVVTHVDHAAWPGGVGAIRFGFDPHRVDAAESQQDFLDQYREAVANYRQVREQIDKLCDQQRLAANIALDEPVDAATLQTWLASVPENLLERELELREAMYAFTAMRELRVGDVISVPNFVPHSLQHGVRVVEFQTPVYERKILSFAQKVLTQSEWDTEAALPLLQVAPPKSSDITVVQRFEGATLEKIVDFADFHAFRLSFQQDAAVDLEPLGDYCLVMPVIGAIDVCGRQLIEQQAAIIPSLINKLSFSGSARSCLLLCAPKSH